MTILEMLLLLIGLILDVPSLINDVLCVVQEAALIEGITMTSFPWCSTADVAELISTKASHVIAAVREFDHPTAALTSAPALLACDLYELLQCCILRAVADVSTAFAQYARFLVAPSTQPHITKDCIRWNKCPTANVVAIRPAFCTELHVFRLEVACELRIDETFGLTD